MHSSSSSSSSSSSMDLMTQKLYTHESKSLSPITSPFVSPTHHSSHNSFPIIAVAIIGILATAFLLVSYYIFVIKCCLNWHRIDLLRRFSFSRNRRVEQPLIVYSPAIENRGLNEAAIRSIPISKFNKYDHQVFEKTSLECAVCLNEFQDDEKLRVIPNCAHFFHVDCIDVWLQNNANCPLCRTSISSNTCGARFPLDQILDPGRNPQDPNTHADNFTGREEDYVVIEIESENHQPLPKIPENSNSNEVLTINFSLKSKKKGKKLTHISSMGDECIDNRHKDEQFVVQPIRRSFSMDSAADTQLYLAVQEIMERNKMEISEVISPNDGSSSSRIKRSFFLFGSRSAVQVQPVGLEP